MLLHGDCLFELNKIQTNSVDLIYLDPPFFTQQEQKLSTYEFNDQWQNINHYLDFMKVRLKECYRVLKNTGSLFLHCDRSASHYLKVLLDDIFSYELFQSEIVWTYKRWSNAKKGLLNAHQIILFYTKSSDFKFNMIYTDYSPTTNIDQIWQERQKDANGKSVYKTDALGNLVTVKEKKGVPLSDVWNIPFLNPKAKERVGYPTQKPILLLEQIIKLVTNEDDLVLDPFCGSGTTLVASKLLNRQFIGIDISEKAIQLTQDRLKTLIKTHSEVLEKGSETFLNKTEFEKHILNHLDAIPVQRNDGIDGFLKYSFRDKPIAIKIQRETESIDEAQQKLIQASQNQQCILKILIRTHLNNQQKAINQSLFDDHFDNNKIQDDHLIIIDSYDIVIKKIIDLTKIT